MPQPLHQCVSQGTGKTSGESLGQQLGGPQRGDSPVHILQHIQSLWALASLHTSFPLHTFSPGVPRLLPSAHLGLQDWDAPGRWEQGGSAGRRFPSLQHLPAISRWRRVEQRFGPASGQAGKEQRPEWKSAQGLLGVVPGKEEHKVFETRCPDRVPGALGEPRLGTPEPTSSRSSRVQEPALCPRHRGSQGARDWDHPPTPQFPRP